MRNDSRASPPTHRVTGLLMAWGDGDRAALDALIPHVQGELRKLARYHMAGERPGHSLQPTALVHEAYLRLGDVRRGRRPNRAHFLALAGRPVGGLLRVPVPRPHHR